MCVCVCVCVLYCLQYVVYFKTNKKFLNQYPNIKRYVQRLNNMPEIRK